MSRMFVVSDLHVGCDGDFNIFAGHEAFPRLAAEVGAGDHLVLNGDAFDFLLDDGPLELEPARERAEAIAKGADGRAVFGALGKALERGARVTVRIGNHDPETALDVVQSTFASHIGDAVHFDGSDVLKTDLHGIRIAISHGERDDDWNRFDRDAVHGDEFSFPPGSKLVKHLLNRVKLDHSMRFADLLKPDVEGALLAILAIEPSAVRLLLQPSVFGLVGQLHRRLRGDLYEAVPGAAQAGADGSIDEEAANALEALMSPEEGLILPPLTRNVRTAWLRAGLRVWARVQRHMAGDAAASFFALDPELDEWATAQAVAAGSDARIVVLGHTHAARLGQFDDLTLANSGTWIPLMRLPPSDAPLEAWTDLLEDLEADPLLADRAKPRIIHRFTAVVLEPTDAGLRVSVDELQDDGRVRLDSRTVARA